MVFAGNTPLGQLMITSDVENYPGFPGGIQGPELMQLFRDQAERFGSTLLDKDVTKVDFSQRPHRLWVGDDEYQADAVIVATGASALWLGLPSEEQFRGRGVSACATCDGFFFRDREIAVVGGGDTALEEALFLTRFASKVTMLVRREAFRGSKIMQDRAFAHPKIDVRWNTEVTEVRGEMTVGELALRDTVSGEASTVPVQGLFIASRLQAEHRPLRRAARPRRARLLRGRGRQPDQGRGRVRGRRRARPPVPPGGHRRRRRLPGRDRRRALARVGR